MHKMFISKHWKSKQIHNSKYYWGSVFLVSSFTVVGKIEKQYRIAVLEYWVSISVNMEQG